MKVAMISEHASPLAALGGVDAGGQNVHVAALSAALARRGHEITVYTRRDDADAPHQVVTPDGYRVVHVPAGPPRPLPKDKLLPHMGEFGAFLRERWSVVRPDVAHAHFWMSGLAAELAARDLEVPVTQTFHALGTVKRRHQGAADTSPPARIRFERLIATRASRVVATCTDEVFELTRMGVPRHRISVVPCGVDTEAFAPDGPAAPPGRYPHRLLSVGRMVPRKGFEIAVRALAELPDTELVIAGGTAAEREEADRLRGIAAEARVSQRVRLLGQVPRSAMPELFRSADAVLCTPWYEPFGMVPLEAMACRRPVVATAVGGMIDTVVDGVTGRLVSSLDPHAIAEAVRPLLADATLRETWGTAGFARARTRYTWDRVATQTLAVYRRAAPLLAGQIASAR
ncbi:glycosyltransferase [Nocardia sp. CDC159]|uniref:Glycosyltransferase n=1 Tax=Nocardia pulmonis TaxID=2951408 RepID=A0A9X2E0Y5_9NOCA|nr:MULTISPECIES: glycosyltransferase [Nocardia]MCM6772124.1 glycosyltransferase [Nocardia pulmonis]MCM6785218.1 glycosyltransferase [Nocardia sp. CDC159]